jgi:hypothetical protein
LHKGHANNLCATRATGSPRAIDPRRKPSARELWAA